MSEVNILGRTKILVSIGSNAGIVQYDGRKYYCNVCEITYCKHVSHIKESKTEIPPIIADFVELQKESNSNTTPCVSKLSIPFFPDKDLEIQLQKPVSCLLTQLDGIFVCAVDQILCDSCHGILDELKGKDMFIYDKSARVHVQGIHFLTHA